MNVEGYVCGTMENGAVGRGSGAGTVLNDGCDGDDDSGGCDPLTRGVGALGEFGKRWRGRDEEERRLSISVTSVAACNGPRNYGGELSERKVSDRSLN